MFVKREIETIPSQVYRIILIDDSRLIQRSYPFYSFHVNRQNRNTDKMAVRFAIHYHLNLPFSFPSRASRTYLTPLNPLETRLPSRRWLLDMIMRCSHPRPPPSQACCVVLNMNPHGCCKPWWYFLYTFQVSRQGMLWLILRMSFVHNSMVHEGVSWLPRTDRSGSWFLVRKLSNEFRPWLVPCCSQGLVGVSAVRVGLKVAVIRVSWDGWWWHRAWAV